MKNILSMALAGLNPRPPAYAPNVITSRLPSQVIGTNHISVNYAISVRFRKNS